ncbi:hypothetical protein [Thalassotalea sp. Y01]|uniref:hypothetical protein n=1 Tax=Thalassotalea sp. Y01 TaxID=2729613 RepID=UPI00145ECA03|nr:hypothetical protein [Thalassotalea sp. Y01]NMP17728.1 hypothetical protein [Thalassotalea sp. Y01]
MSDIDTSRLKSFSKLTAKSYNDQKALIKKVLLGRPIQCKSCRKEIQFVAKTANSAARVRCKTGCTDIELDIG